MKFCEIVVAVLAYHANGVQLVANLLRGEVRERGVLVSVTFEGHQIHGLIPHVAQLEPSLIPILDEQEPGIITLKPYGHPQRVCARRKCRLRRKCDRGGSRSY